MFNYTVEFNSGLIRKVVIIASVDVESGYGA